MRASDMKCARLGPGWLTDGLGLTILMIVVGVAELIAVELRTGDSGCGHCLTTVQLNLPSQSVPPASNLLGLNNISRPCVAVVIGSRRRARLVVAGAIQSNIEVLTANPTRIVLKPDD